MTTEEYKPPQFKLTLHPLSGLSSSVSQAVVIDRTAMDDHMSQDFSTYTGSADVSNWRGTVNGRLPSIRELLRQLPDPDGRPDLEDDTDT